MGTEDSSTRQQYRWSKKQIKAYTRNKKRKGHQKACNSYRCKENVKKRFKTGLASLSEVDEDRESAPQTEDAESLSEAEDDEDDNEMTREDAESLSEAEVAEDRESAGRALLNTRTEDSTQTEDSSTRQQYRWSKKQIKAYTRNKKRKGHQKACNSYRCKENVKKRFKTGLASLSEVDEDQESAPQTEDA